MTCESFNSIVHDLATGRPVDGRLERDARAHQSDCETCSTALEEQRRVTSLLGAVAAEDAELEAPGRIEATVLGAFRLAHGTANVVPLRPVVAAPVVGARRFSHSWMAVAATIVVGVAATLVSWQAMRSGPIVAPPSDRGSIAEDPPAGRATEKPPVAPPVDERAGDGQYPGAAPGRGGGGGPVIPVSNSAGGRRFSRPTRALPESEPQELVTDFFSLVPASGFAPTEGGQLVRLEVPRASLASLGVPIPVGNPDGSVTADLVMGYDGVAHAIRFVQPRMTDERRTR